MRRVLRPRSLTVLLTLFALTATSAWARPEEGNSKVGKRGIRAVAMPFVEGADAEAAIKRLEQLRLQVRVITIAGRAPGVVDRQQPKPNSALQPGQEVVLYVGIEPFVQTIVPDVRGMTQEDALYKLEEAYVLDINLVAGNPRDAGRIIRQRPAAGRRLALRGVLELDVVRPVLRVPSFQGKTEAQARAIADALGLVLEIDYAIQAATAPDRVLSQYPHAGSEILPGGLVRLEISGGGGGHLPIDRVSVPRLLGATLAEAQHLVLAAGLVPQIEFTTLRGARALTVVRQREAAGTLLRVGDTVHFTVAIGGTAGTRVEVPSFLGMRGADAARIATELGLRPTIQRRASGLRPGTVLGQSPGEGSRVRSGSQIILTVSVRTGGTPNAVIVPRVEGLDILRARATLFSTGLGVIIKRAEAPNEPVDRVAHQSPAAGRRVREGSQVTLVFPIATRMPDLIGKRVRQANQLLQAAGLAGIAEGPQFGIGRRQVTRQALPPGAQVARGSEVAFQYVYTGVANRFRVPDFIGMTKRRAERAAQDAGIAAVFRGADTSLSRVSAQSLAAGTVIPPSTAVVLTLSQAGGIPGGVTLVPSVVNRTLREARQLLQAAGLRIEVVGRGNFTDQSIVRGQSPAAGTRLQRGTVVSLEMQRIGGGAGLIAVPDVKGKSKRRAKEILEGAGFAVRVKGLDISVRGVKTKVRKQDPDPGTRLPRGSEVTITLGF